MVGDERGFGPERPVTRAEMAVVMGKLLNLDYNYYTAICPFDDVYDWARGRVGACYANGIVSGRGEGVYDPGATVTAVEAASMLMRALGYFQYTSLPPWSSARTPLPPRTTATSSTLHRSLKETVPTMCTVRTTSAMTPILMITRLT